MGKERTAMVSVQEFSEMVTKSGTKISARDLEMAIYKFMQQAEQIKRVEQKPPSAERVIYPKLKEPLRTLAISAHDALHTVWTKAATARAASYDKAEWNKLMHAIERLVRAADGDFEL